MAQNTYYPEEVLIEKMERGEYGWLGYVNHFSAEWQEELVEYCKAHSLTIDDTAGGAIGPPHRGHFLLVKHKHGLWQYEPTQTR